MAETATHTHAHLGRDRNYESLDEYNSGEAFAKQDESRTVKMLMFTYHVIAPSPMVPGEEVIMEKVGRQNDIIPLEELGTYYLKRGEQLDAFYTDEELAAIKAGRPLPYQVQPAGETAGVLPGGLPAGGPVEPADFEGDGSFSELGSHEMVAYMEEHEPTVDQLGELIGNDPDAARRLLEAENVVTDNDPRAGVEKLVQKVIKDNS